MRFDNLSQLDNLCQASETLYMYIVFTEKKPYCPSTKDIYCKFIIINSLPIFVDFVGSIKQRIYEFNELLSE
jgi:hypothetical protein